MMIAGLEEIKTLLGLTDTTYDARISALIPMSESDLLYYTNNQFLNTEISFGGQCTITASGGAYKVVCAEGGMDDVGFAVDDVVLLSGSERNDQYLTIATIADGYISFDETLIAQTDAASMDLTLAVFPAALKIYVSKMVGWQLFHMAGDGVNSESIGNYSYSRSDAATDAGYPNAILRGLDRWRLMSTKRGQVRDQFRDYRGSTAGLGTSVTISDIVRGGA